MKTKCSLAVEMVQSQTRQSVAASPYDVRFTDRLSPHAFEVSPVPVASQLRAMKKTWSYSTSSLKQELRNFNTLRTYQYEDTVMNGFVSVTECMKFAFTISLVHYVSSQDP